MIFLDKLQLYPYFTNNIDVKMDVTVPYNIMYVSENSTYLDSHQYITIKKTSVKYVTYVVSNIPRIIHTMVQVKPYINLGMIFTRDAYMRKSKYVDMSEYLDAVDAKYHPGQYQRNNVNKLILNKMLEFGNASGFHNVLLYHINLDKDVPLLLLNRRIFPFMQYVKSVKGFENTPFQYIVMLITKDGKSRYICIKNPEKSISYNTFLSLMLKTKSVKHMSMVTPTDDAVNKILDSVGEELNPDSADEAINRVKTYLDKNKELTNEINNADTVTKELSKEILVKSVNTTDDEIKNNSTDLPVDKKTPITTVIRKLQAPVAQITKDNQDDENEDTELDTNPVTSKLDKEEQKRFERVNAELSKEVVTRSKYIQTNSDIVYSNVDLNKINDGKEPSHILNKRLKECNELFYSQLVDCFKFLEKKNPPLKLKNIKMEDIPVPPGDLSPSYFINYEVTLQDDMGKDTVVNIQIPKLFENGTFMINGSRKYLIYQMLLDPIYFLKDGIAKLESMYASFAIHLHSLRNITYFTCYVAGYKNIPLFILMSYFYGFEYVCKLFKITYYISDKPNKNGILSMKLEDGKYMSFTVRDKCGYIMVESLYRNIKHLKISSTNFKSPELYKNYILYVTHNRNSVFKIEEVFSNIIEPITAGLLKSKNLPTDVPNVIYYICLELSKGRVDARNDLRFQRIRNMEVFIAQIQKLILGSYNMYRTKRLMGDKEAKYYLDTTTVVKEIINSKLVRDMENINPIEELSCLTRTTPVGEGGVPDMNAITLQARDINDSYFGSIDAMDTPEGSILPDAKVLRNKEGLLTTLNDICVGDEILYIDGNEYSVVGKKVHPKRLYNLKLSYDINIGCSNEHRYPVYDTFDNTEKVLMLSDIKQNIKRYKFIRYKQLVKEYVDIISIEETDEIVEMVDIQVDTPDNTFILESGIVSHNSNVGVINQLTVDAAVTSIYGSFIDRSTQDNLKSSVLSVNSAMIPFVNSTDGCRVMFSGSQGRQTIPVEGNEPPMVQTGYETVLTSLLSSDYIKKSVGDGEVIYVDNDYIKVKYKNGKVQTISLKPIMLRSGQGQNSLSYYTPKCKKGDKVSEGQVLAENNYIKNGVICQGANLLAACMHWKGYAFEDGYIISERIANETFRSNSYHEIELIVSPDDNISYIATPGKLTKQGEPLMLRTSKEIESLLDIDEDEILQGSLVTKSPGGKVLDVEIFPNSNIRKHPVLRPVYESFREKYIQQYGSFPEKFVYKTETSDKEQFAGILIKFKVVKSEQCDLGDKITNSFGGKGVLSHVEKDKYMPRTPFGEVVDLILNPIAIINRMNPSTIKEMHTGLLCKFLAHFIVKCGYDKNDVAINKILEVYRLMDGSKDKRMYTAIYKIFQNMSKSDYKTFVDNIVKNKYIFSIILPPFNDPTIDNIQKAMNCVGAKQSYKLYLPEWNTYTTKNINVGYIYYKKLEQQSHIKMSARSTGLVDPRTGQPMAGRKAGGGQRVGEMDSWAIISHGAINVLREMYGPLSDDFVTKNEIITDIIQKGEAKYRKPKVSPTFDRLQAYLYGLMLDAPIKKSK